MSRQVGDCKSIEHIGLSEIPLNEFQREGDID